MVRGVIAQVPPVGEHGDGQVAVGEEADRSLAVDQHDRADVALAHHLGDLAHRPLGRRRDDGFGHDLADEHGGASLQSLPGGGPHPSPARPRPADRIPDSRGRPCPRPAAVRGRPRVADRRAQRDRPRAAAAGDGSRRRSHADRRRARADGLTVAATTPQQALEWEGRQGPRAAIAAAVGALLVIASGVATATLFKGAPVPGFADSLARAGHPGGVGSLPSLRTPYYQFYDDRSTSVLLTAIGRGLGFVAIAFMLTYLGSAVRNRARGFRALWIYVALAGGLLGAIATVMFTIGTSAEISNFLDGPHTVDRANHIGNSTVLVAAQLIGVPGTQAIGVASLALGMGWVVICLNAMRIGLLTRFMGVLGVICGVLIVLPILSPLPIVQTFWLGAMAVLFAKRWPNGAPAAWATGEAQPWPSQAEVREARRAQVQRRRGGAPESAPEPEALPSPERPHPAGSKKKKRKRRS